MTTWPVAGFTITAASNFSVVGGGAIVGHSFGLGVPVETAGFASGGVPTGFAWFDAEATVSAGVAWIAVTGDSNSDQTNRLQIAGLWGKVAGVWVPLPVRPLSTVPSVSPGYRSWIQPRLARFGDGRSLNSLGVTEFKIRVHTEQFDIAPDVAGGNGLRARMLQVSYAPLPAPAPTKVKTGSQWSPGVRVAPLADFPAQAAHVTVTAENGALNKSGVVLPDPDGAIRWQHPGTISRAHPATIELVVFYPPVGSVDVTHTHTETITDLTGGPAVGPTAVVAGDGLSVTVGATTGHDVRIDRRVGAAGEVETVHDGPSTPGTLAVVDLPPLNATTNYLYYAGDGPSVGLDGERKTGGGQTASAAVSLTHHGWVLSSIAPLEHYPMVVESVRDERESTTSTSSARTGYRMLRGRVDGPVWSLGVTVESADDYAKLLRILAADRVLLRGPHSERSWVQLVGRVSGVSGQLWRPTKDPLDRGTLAEVGYRRTVSLTLATDPRW